MSSPDDVIWSAERRRTLVAVADCFWPMDDQGVAASAVANVVIQSLATQNWAGRDSLALAVLDELDERSGDGGFSAQPPAVKESLLRALEGETNPYLAHGVVTLLQLCLEGHLGDPSRGGNPGGRGWVSVGLPTEGPARCMEPIETEPIET